MDGSWVKSCVSCRRQRRGIRTATAPEWRSTVRRASHSLDYRPKTHMMHADSPMRIRSCCEPAYAGSVEGPRSDWY